MSVDFTWKITRLEIVDKDGLKNVAIQACFDVSGVDENDLRGFIQSDVLLGAPDPKKFIDISAVTEAQAIAWVKAALGDRVAEFEGQVAEQIGWQKSNQPKPANLPWITPDAPAETTAAE